MTTATRPASGTQAATGKSGSGRRKSLPLMTIVQRTMQSILMVMLALFCLAPFVWLALSSVDADAGPTTQMPAFTMDNFVRFFADADTPRLLINSLLIAVSATALNLFLGILGGYALSRYRFRGRRFFMFSILLIRVVPPPATIVALYLMMVKINLDDSYIGLILVEAAVALPVTLWLLKGTIDAIPYELEEAAWMDGSTRLGAVRKIIFPLAGPGLGAAAMLTFMAVWGDFLTPLVLLQSPDMYPLSIGLFRAFTAFNQVDWGVLTASAVIYMVPPAILYGFLRRHLLRSSLGGAVKG